MKVHNDFSKWRGSVLYCIHVIAGNFRGGLVEIRENLSPRNCHPRKFNPRENPENLIPQNFPLYGTHYTGYIRCFMSQLMQLPGELS